MATLNKTQKRFIVERLAVWDTPTEVAEAFYERFDVNIPRQQVNNYDASREYGRKRMAEDLVQLFDDTRAAFREETKQIAIANKAWRLRQLGKIARENRSPKIKMEALEQAAKESGGKYERSAKGTEDDPVHHVEQTLEDWKKDAAARRQQVSKTMEKFNDEAGDE